jgi:hypothetical protein
MPICRCVYQDPLTDLQSPLTHAGDVDQVGAGVIIVRAENRATRPCGDGHTKTKALGCPWPRFREGAFVFRHGVLTSGSLSGLLGVRINASPPQALI